VGLEVGQLLQREREKEREREGEREREREKKRERERALLSQAKAQKTVPTALATAGQDGHEQLRAHRRT